VVKDLNNATVGTATVLANGTWSLTSTGPVAEGTLTATATDINGEVGTDTAGYTDSVVPVVVITEPVVQNTNGTLTVSGTGEAGASVVVKDVNDVQIGTATVLENGTWTLTSTGPVAEGTLTATATDINGEVGTDTAGYTDNKGPETPVIDALDSDQDGKINASGTAEPLSTVLVTWPDGTTSSIEADDFGDWAVESPTVQARGTVSAKAMDINGQVSASATVPYATVTNLEVVDTDGNGKPTVSGQTLPDLEVTIEDPSGATHTTTADANGKFKFEIDPAPSPLIGDYSAKATYGANHSTNPVTVTATDLTAPVISALNVSDANTDGKPTISGQVDTPNAVVTIVDPAGATHTVATGSDGVFSLEITVAQGFVEGDYKVTAQDAAGNVSLPTLKNYSEAEPLVINEPVTQNPNGTLTVTGTGEIGATVEVTDVNGNPVGTTTITVNGQGIGTWTVTSTASVPEGTLTASAGVGITATDTTFYENKPVAVDDLGQGTEDSTTLTGNVSTNDTHKDGSEVFTLDSSATGTYGSLVLGTGGAWTYTRNITDLNAITAFVKDEFTYTVRDDAGNESSATLTIQLDPVNDAPTMSVSTAYNPFNEDAGPVAAFVGQLSLADVDSANLSGATVLVRLQPSGSFYSGDVLAASVTAGSGIEAHYNATTGLLTLSGMATKAAYQEVLNSVTFNNLRDDISSAARRITWTVTDESGTSNTTLTRSYVSTTRKNDAPVLADTNLAMPNVQPTTEELAMGAMPTGQVGVLVSSLMGGLSDPDLATQLLVKGIAVVGVNRALGELYFSADDGGSWHSYGTVLSLSDQNSLLLRGDNTTRVYFRPHVGVEGTIADAFTFRGWDASDVGSRPTLSGAQVNTYTITATGGTSAYSTATDTVSLTVATMASAGYAGTSGDDPMMIGTTGDDVMVGNGGADQFTAGDGNDLVVLNAANVTALSASNAANVDGGAGVNTLKLSGADMLLDLNDAVVQGKVHNFSTIDLVGNGHNMLKLGLSDVQSLSGASDDANTVDVNEAQMLVVKGNDGDAVVLDNTASWSQLVGLKGADLTALYGAAHGFVTSHTYSQYTKSGATLFVDELTAVADFVGTVGADALTGTAGADVLFGNGGADTLDGGDGHDKIILNSRVIADLGGSVNVDIDGGAGVNTLTVVGRNLTLDLTNATVFSKLDNFNVLDMHQGGGNEIKISLQEVLALSGAVDDVATAIDESKMLVVQGNASNTTNALVLSDGSNWSQTTIVGGTTMANTYGAQYGFEAGHSYVQYNSNSGAATLFVDQTLIQPVL
jgi:VCBS repeat-containing protein